jgi:hypothetical protein
MKLADLTEADIKDRDRDIIAVDPARPDFHEIVRGHAADTVREGQRATVYPPPLEVEIDSADPTQLQRLKEMVG